MRLVRRIRTLARLLGLTPLVLMALIAFGLISPLFLFFNILILFFFVLQWIADLQLKQRNRLIRAQGTRAQAVILKIQTLDSTDYSPVPVHFWLDVCPPHGRPLRAEAEDSIPTSWLPELKPGKIVQILYYDWGDPHLCDAAIVLTV